MELKKKFLGFYVFLLLLLSGPLCENTFASTYTDYFNIKSGDLINIYDIFKGNALTYSNQNDSNYNNMVTLWTSGEEMLQNKTDEELDQICDYLNRFMFETWIVSGEYNGIWGYDTNLMNDANLIIMAQPADSVSTSTKKVRFIFYPEVSTSTYLNETGSYQTNNFTIQPTIYNRSGDGETLIQANAYSNNPAIYLIFNATGDPSYHFRSSSSDQTAFNNNHKFYSRTLETPYNNRYIYSIGFLYTFRNNPNYGMKGQVYFKKYNNTQYILSNLGFRYNLSTQRESSGEILPDPTPTPAPTSSGGSLDLSETNNLISNIENSLTYTPSGDDFQTITQSNIDDITNGYQVHDSGDSFWAVLIDGLHGSLTDDVPYFTFTIFNHTYEIVPISINYPTVISAFFTTMTTFSVILVSLKFWRDIIHKLQSGGALEVAHMFSGFDWSNYF